MLFAELTLAREIELMSASAPESILAFPTESKLIFALESPLWLAGIDDTESSSKRTRRMLEKVVQWKRLLYL